MGNDNTTRHIFLETGEVVLVDSEDYPLLSRYAWHMADNYIAHSDHRPSGETFTTKMHRFILGATYGQFVDHINGDCLDNRKCNLRICTKEQNNRNRRKQAGCSSQYKGVNINRAMGKWVARITARRKRIHLGYFDNEQDAALAYNNAAIELHGEYARLNEVNVADNY